ncbi:Transcription factor [Penicillium riverlandense]|uniref:Transcription factor n=1 Tax=Penicillium riverlandense TaxID=1903569 RepID=UPI00254670CD|nr:Transcription factor [Penicillium riverlandense]KAJ5833014.1 Transcription factor [Penicillium riverlandense]
MYERQRVWRACQPCRRKKVKCDGEHPCESCTRNQAECVYIEPSNNMRMVDQQYLMKLESQIQMMEKRLHEHSQAQPSTGHDGQTSQDVQAGQEVQDSSGGMLPPAPHVIAVNVPGSDNANRGPHSLLDQPGDRLNEVPGIQQLEDIAVPPQHPEPAAIDVTQLPEPLLQLLIDLFYRSIYPIFPIISQCDFQPQFDRWLSARQGSRVSEDDEFLLLLYALLAVASFLLPAEHAIFDQPGLKAYKHVDLGDLLYTHATPKYPERPSGPNATSATNFVVAQGLVTLYLTECGKVNDAWIRVGHAIRLYQALDLDNGVDAAAEVNATGSAHGNLWWCLYILDRSLSTVLLKPLAIDNAESNMDSYEGERQSTWRSEDKIDPWFPVIAEFHIILGRIYKSVRWIRRCHPSQNTELGDTGTLRSNMKKYDIELERYFTKRVLPKMQRHHGTARPLPLQNVAESSYYIGLVLLYRTFIERLKIEEPEVFLRCAEAASSCIRVTPQVMATVPASHFVIQQCRAVYTSTKVLLHCMRLVKNTGYTNNAWPDVQRGCDILRKTKVQWPEIKRYQKLTEEDMYRTQIHLSKHELFNRVFDRYGQENLSRPSGDSGRNRGSLQRTSTSHTNGLHQCLPGIAHNDHICRHRDLVNNASDADNLTRTPQSLISHNYGHDARPSEREPKRRRLSQNFYAPPAPYTHYAPNTPPMLPEADGLPMLNTTTGPSDFLLPDISPLPPVPGDSPSDFLEDTMLMSSFDLIFSHSE